MGTRSQEEYYKENAKLVAAVREFPCIYDRNNAAFMSKDACDAAWEAIDKKCNVPDTRNRWRNIRSAFSRSYFGNLRRSTTTKYYLASVLEWLVPHMLGNVDSDAATTQDEDSMPPTSNLSNNEVSSKRNSSIDKDPLGDEEMSHIVSDLLSPKSAANEADSDRRSRYQRACKRATAGNSPVKDADPQQQSPKDLTPKRRKYRMKDDDKSTERQPPHAPRTEAEANNRSPERSQPQSHNPPKVSSNGDAKNFNSKKFVPLRQGTNSDNEHVPQVTQTDLAEVDTFFTSVTPYVVDMNKRQFIHFKKIVFGAIMDVYDDPKDFPDSAEGLVNPSPRSLIFENVTAKEHYLMRELVATVIASKQSSEILQLTNTASSPADILAPPPPVPMPEEKVVEKLAEKASPDLPTSSTTNQVQPGVGDAAKPARNLYLVNSPSPRQQVASNMSPPGLTGKVVRLGNGSIDTSNQVYRIVQKMPSGSVMVSKAPNPAQSPVNTFTIPSASPTHTFSNSSTVITSTSTLGATPGSIASGSSVVSLRAMPGFKPQQPQHHQQTQHLQPTAATNITPVNRNILSMISPGKVGIMRRNSMAGVLPNRLERRTSTIVGNNMPNVPGNINNMVVPRYAPGMTANRAVRTIMPIRTQGRAESSTITTRHNAGDHMPTAIGYGASMARSTSHAQSAMSTAIGSPAPVRRTRPPGTMTVASMPGVRNSPHKITPLVVAERPSPLQILEADNHISLDIKHEPDDL